MSYKNGLSNKEISEALRLLSDTDLVKNYLVKKSINLAADRIDFNDSLIAELEQQLSAIKEFVLALSQGGFEEFKFNDSNRPITAPQEVRE